MDVSVAGASHTPPNLQVAVVVVVAFGARGGAMEMTTEEGPPLPLPLPMIPALGKADTVVGVGKKAKGIAPPCSPLLECA